MDVTAQPAVFAEQLEFCDAFFPAPNVKTRPQLTSNPFAELLEAETLTEVVIRARFVSDCVLLDTW